MTPRTTIIAVAAILGVALLSYFDVLKKNNEAVSNNVDSQTKTPTINTDFQFSSQESTTGHPVFISERYHFRFAPQGNYGSMITGSRGVLLNEIGVSTADSNAVSPQNLTLLMYSNTNGVMAGDIMSFRAWRKEALYNNPSDPITTVTLRGFTLLKATQVDGINSKSTYYYLIRPDYIYVFVTGLDNPDQSIQKTLTAFTLTS